MPSGHGRPSRRSPCDGSVAVRDLTHAVRRTAPGLPGWSAAGWGDAPIRGAEDIRATPLAARVVNVNPAPIGSLRARLDGYARCAQERRPMSGGGFGELGVARGQISYSR